MPYFSLHMAFYGIFDSECRESEVQITSTPRSKHLASMFAYKKSGLKKPGNGWCAWVFSGASIPFGNFGCGGRIWTDGLRVMSGCPGVYSCRASWKKPWNYNGLYKIAWCIVTAYYGIVGIISSHIVPAILYHLTSCLINTCTLCYS